MSQKYPELFSPTVIGSIPVKNRYAMGPMGPLGFGDANGGWNQRGIEYYSARAKGGIGLIITGVCQVVNAAEKLPGGLMPNPSLNPGVFLSTSRELVERVHAFDSKIVLQAGAGFGRVLVPAAVPPGQSPAAPSAIPYMWDPSITCREMTKDEIKQIVKQFAITAQIAKQAGYDGIQVHAVHEGYLLDQFAIEFYNRRTDEYGGSLENRLRFAREIVEMIHHVAGDDFPVQLRYSVRSMVKDFNDGALPGEEFEEKGRDFEEGVEAAKLLHSYGYETLDVDQGTYDSWFWNHPPMYQEKGMYMPDVKRLKDAAPEIPIIMAGRMDNPELAHKAITEGYCDMISLARPTLADADIVNKLEAGKPETVRPCISCQEGCIGRIASYLSIRCAVNPQAGRESDAVLLPTPRHRAKKVMIVGGGLAGLESARVLAEREHTPVLYEESDRLGGVVIAGGQPSFKEDDLALIAWYEQELEALGVEVHLNTEVTPDMIKSGDWDHVLVATGSNPRMLDLGDATEVVEATDALLAQDDLGKKVVVIGGGLTGCELALSLVEKGREVTIVEVEKDLLAKNGPLCHANHDMLHKLVPYRGIEVLTEASAIRTTDKGLLVKVDGEERDLEADSVVSAIGYVRDSEMWETITDVNIPKNILGDARKISNIQYAIWDAYEVASKL
ncbi:FAD-dependent oxidoreductase [Dermabacter sp. p3-SID358]|uniref:oxidoreductase n=1 Tax=Dermabacter sp. p3-SID358 TaxID=2916114 RepID=UPI0021A74658|nr:FAD-dependent oxidoreductase [Dermabacter sp. p3-SID358]MCT1867468.1 FAD-dependent oxidoreductase [Dermabacter sp. p3-SID358]